MQSEGKVVMINLKFLWTLVNILRQKDLPGELIRVVFVPEATSVHLSHHPIKTLLQLEIFSHSKGSEDIEQHLFADVERIAAKFLEHLLLVGWRPLLPGDPHSSISDHSLILMGEETLSIRGCY